MEATASVFILEFSAITPNNAESNGQEHGERNDHGGDILRSALTMAARMY